MFTYLVSESRDAEEPDEQLEGEQNVPLHESGGRQPPHGVPCSILVPRSKPTHDVFLLLT